VQSPPDTFSSTQEAEQWTRDNLGIATVDYRHASVPAATVVTQALAHAQAAGVRLPRAVVFDRQAFRHDAEATSLNPAHGGRLSVNPENVYWLGRLADLALAARELRSRGMWATADPRHPILHELGHLAHWEAKRASWDDGWGDRGGPAAVERALAAQVSRRAEHSPAQFVAEVFAGLRLGETYSVEVLALYTLYGGLQP
jgi:hypothetical protein